MQSETNTEQEPEFDITSCCSCKDIEWHGCYGSGAKYNKYIIPESVKHPAKMSWELLERIFKHLESMNLLTPDSVIIDFMAGSGRSGTMASLRRYRTISVELEPHFIEMMTGYDCNGKSISDFKIEPCVCKSDTLHKPHKIKTGLFEVECSGNPRIIPVCRCGDKRPHKKHHVCGNKELLEQAVGRRVKWDIIQGDARELTKLLHESDLVGVVSPPYFSQVAYQDKEFIKSIAEDKSQRYRDGRLKGHFATPEAIQRYAEKIMENYSLDPRNIGNLPDAPLAGIISPPYADQKHNYDHGLKELGGNFKGRKAWEERIDTNPLNPDNISNLKDIPLVGIMSPPYQDTAMPMGCPAHIRKLAREGNWDKAIELERKAEAEQAKKGNKFAVSTDETIRKKIEMALEREKGNYSENSDNIGNLKDKPLPGAINILDNIRIEHDRRNGLGVVGGISGRGGGFSISQSEGSSRQSQTGICLATDIRGCQQISRINSESGETLQRKNDPIEAELRDILQHANNFKQDENSVAKNNSIFDNQETRSDSSLGSIESFASRRERWNSRCSVGGTFLTNTEEPQATSFAKTIAHLVGIMSPPYSEAQLGGGIAIKGYRGAHMHEMGKNQPDKVGQRCGYMKEVHGNDPANIGNLPDRAIVGITSPPYLIDPKNVCHTREGKTLAEYDIKRGYQPTAHQTTDYSTNPLNIGNQPGESYLSAMFKVYQQAYLCGISPLVIVTKNPTRNGKLRRLDLDTIYLLQLSGYEIFDYHRSILFESHKQGTLDGESKDVHKGRISFFKRLSLEKGTTVAQFEDVIFARIPIKMRSPCSGNACAHNKPGAPDQEG